MGMGKLNDRAVKAAAPGKHGDGDGLILLVSNSGSRSWVLRFQLAGKRRDMGLGSYPEIGLADAREAAREARRLAAKGIDPVLARAASRKAERKIPTFAEVAARVIEEAQRNSGNAKVRYQWERHLGPAYVAPLLPRAITEITVTDVAAVLRPIWHTKPEVARKLLPAIRRVFDHRRVYVRAECGIEMGSNPASWSDLRALGFERPVALSWGHHPSLPYASAPEFMAALRTRDAVAARALEFMILTNVRTDAVLNARWRDIDFEAAIWLVPIANLKDKRHRTEPFRVPLSEPAMTLLRQMLPMKEGELVFPGHRTGRPLSNMAMLTLLKRMNTVDDGKWFDPVQGRPITAHGFRATFRTWAEETVSAPHAVIEQAMGHQVGTQVERAYRRTDMLDHRRRLMNQWAQWLGEEVAEKVVSFARAK